jgi:pimeloyl-ACP methyl ester carboxylesterase
LSSTNIAILIGFFAAVAATPLLCLLLGFRYVPIVVRIFGEPPMLLPDDSPTSDEGEDVDVLTADGLTLRGTYLPTTCGTRLGVIAFCHELRGNRWSAFRYLEPLRDAGYDVFTFDFRNHGDSDSVKGYQPLPWLIHDELDDVRAVIDYLTARADADPQGIGLLGVSKGGTAALCAAAGDPRVRAIVTDGAFPTEGMQLHFTRRYMSIYVGEGWWLSRFPDLPLVLLSKWGRALVSRKVGYSYVHVESFARRVKQPVLMIHGEKDSMIPLPVGARLRGYLAGTTKMWVVPRAKHNTALGVAHAEYHVRLTRFFARHLAPPKPARTPVSHSGFQETATA